MSNTPFIKFYPSDFLGGTSGLSPAERGVYITLLCLMYEEDGPIARDDARLSRRCGSPKAAFRRALSALMDEGKITEDDGMLSNDRAKRALVDRRNRTESATHAANQKWTAQREKTQQKQEGDDAGAYRAQCGEVCAGDASQKPEPEPEVKKEPKGSSKKRRRKPEVELPEGWVPNEKNITDAQKKGFTITEIDHEADSFRNHHHSKQSLYRDWDAAWRTWLNNAIKFGRRGSMAGGQAPNGYGQGGSIASVVARRRAEGKV